MSNLSQHNLQYKSAQLTITWQSIIIRWLPSQLVNGHLSQRPIHELFSATLYILYCQTSTQAARVFKTGSDPLRIVIHFVMTDIVCIDFAYIEKPAVGWSAVTLLCTGKWRHFAHTMPRGVATMYYYNSIYCTTSANK